MDKTNWTLTAPLANGDVTVTLTDEDRANLEHLVGRYGWGRALSVALARGVKQEKWQDAMREAAR